MILLLVRFLILQQDMYYLFTHSIAFIFYCLPVFLPLLLVRLVLLDLDLNVRIIARELIQVMI
ncbi:MAG TPA: hypothetical protein DDY37_06370 [Legionella sp.]|nr:hypothetical protein [Legionella sp.]